MTSTLRAWAGCKAQGTNLLNVEGYGTICPGRSTALKRKGRSHGGGRGSADESSCQIRRSGSCSAYCYELLKFTPEQPAPSVFLSLHFNWLVVKFFKHCEIADIHCNIMWIIYGGCSRQAFPLIWESKGEGEKKQKESAGGARAEEQTQPHVVCWMLNASARVVSSVWDFREVCTIQSY